MSTFMWVGFIWVTALLPIAVLAGRSIKWGMNE